MKKFLLVVTSIFLLTIQAKSQKYLWANAIGGGSNDIGRVMAVDNVGNVLLAGTFWGTVDFDPGSGTNELTSSGMRDAFLAKYSENGELIWVFSIGDDLDDDITDVKLDNEGNIIITGSYMGTIDLDPGPSTASFTAVMDNNDGFLAKYSSSGNYIWGHSFGSFSNDYGKHLAINSANDIYLAGYFNYSVDFDFGPSINELTGQFDIFLAKYDKDGNHSWVFKIGANGQEYTHGLGFDKDQNILVYGRFQQTVDFDPGNNTSELTSSSNHDLFLAKYTPSGNFMWVKQFSGPGNKYGQGLTTDAANNIYIAGATSQSMDADPSGNTVNISSGGTSPFVIKLDENGLYQWHHLFSTNGGIADMGRIMHQNGYIFLTGRYSGTLTDTVSSTPVSYPSAGNEDIFIGKLNVNTGKLAWLHAVGGPGLDAGTDIHAMANERFYICGGFNGTCDFNFNPTEVNNLTADGEIDIYLAKYNESTVSVENHPFTQNKFEIFPNPSSGILNINGSYVNAVYEIIDFTGNTILTIKPHSEEFQLNLNLAAGVYLLRDLQTGFSQKLILQ
jgi:hypothetical protein